MRPSLRGDGVAETHRPRLDHLRVDAEIDALAVGGARAAVVPDHPQGVEVADARVGVARGERAAVDGAADADARVADPEDAALPLVLLVLAAPVEREQHAEPAPVDLGPGGAVQ